MNIADENKAIIKCTKCENKMYRSQLGNGVPYLQLYLRNKKKGILEDEHTSSVSCYVCSHCGYIELYADDPKGVKLN